MILYVKNVGHNLSLIKLLFIVQQIKKEKNHFISLLQFPLIYAPKKMVHKKIAIISNKNERSALACVFLLVFYFATKHIQIKIKHFGNQPSSVNHHY